MGRVRNSDQVPHRAGPLIQANKKHKSGRHRSKGMLDAEARGRVGGSLSSVGKQKIHVKRSERRKLAAANRGKKIQEVLDKKRLMGGMRRAPISVGLIPITSTGNARYTLQYILKNSANFANVIGQSETTVNLKLSGGKNVSIIVPPSNDFWAVLDTLKLCDVVLFVMPVLEPISEEGKTLIKCAKEQGLSTSFLAVTSNFAKGEEKQYLKVFDKILPVEKIFPLSNPGQISHLLRMISVTKMIIPRQYSMRSGMLIESYRSLQIDQSQIGSILPHFESTPESIIGQDFLQVTGHIRRRNLNPRRNVHITGSGTYQIFRMDVTQPDAITNTILNESPPCPPRYLYDPNLESAELDEERMVEVLDKKRLMGGMRGAPISVGLIPITSTGNARYTLQYILKNSANFANVIGQSETTVNLKLSGGKNVSIIVPPSNDFWAVLDTLKLCDVVLFVMPVLEPISEEGKTLIKCAKEQGLSTSFLAVTSNFAKGEEKQYLKVFDKILPVEKIFPLSNPGQISHLLRMISVTKIIIPRQYSMRSGMLIESYRPFQIDQSQIGSILPHFEGTPESITGQDFLQVTGHIRRRNLNPRRNVHITGSGTYQILRIDVTQPNAITNTILNESPPCPPRYLYDPNLESAELDEERMVEVNEDDGSMSIASDDLDMDVDDGASQRSQKRIPKGTSDYQADWFEKSVSEGDGLIFSDDECENGSQGTQEDGDEDEMDWAEEQKQMRISKAARTEAEFPDWIDTPMDRPAKERFQRYRGLQSFKTSPWDLNENLPKEYLKICQFQNYRHTFKKTVREDPEDGPGYIPVGQRITMILKPVGNSASFFSPGNSQPVALFSLLRHENRMSVLNLHLNVNEIQKNKENMIFQVGFHRFQSKPILSEISTGNKHKMLRFAQENMSCMATIFGPIVFPVASVLAFKTSVSSLVHIGSGSVFSIDPTRIIVKRVLLSGSPFRTHGRKSTVRFMFFSRKDIEWFKPVELKTRYGRRGHIKEPLGTHGHMKCTFDGPLKSQDTVLMPLYKRVFPKWNYDENVPRFSIFDVYEK